MNERRNKIGTWIGFVIILVWCLLPVAWIISLSFKGPRRDRGRQPAVPARALDASRTTGRARLRERHAGPGEHQQRLPRARCATRSASRSIATLLSVIFATLAAYAIARLEFRGKRLVLSLALAIAMFPVVALVGPLFDLWRTLGLFNTWPGLIIPYMSFTLPLAIWTLSAFFREIPWEMEQAAQVDGATSWQAFRKVIVPLAAPGCVHRGDPDVLLRLERVRARASR